MSNTFCPTCRAPVQKTQNEYGDVFRYVEEAKVEELLDIFDEDESHKIPIQVKKLSNFVDLPKYSTDLASGADVPVAASEPFKIKPGEVQLVPTGIAVSIIEGFEIQIRPRSGTPKKKGITVANSPGTIDADYTGEVLVMAYNFTDKEVTIEPGEHLAQMVLAPVVQAEWEIVDELDDTKRGSGGFNSTGS